MQPDESTAIEMNEAVALTFALRYLNSFAKATSLSPTVVRGRRQSCTAAASWRCCCLLLEGPLCVYVLRRMVACLLVLPALAYQHDTAE